MGQSILDQLAELDPTDRQAYVDALSPEELDLLVHRDWSVSARPEQLLPGTPGSEHADAGDDWLIWLIRAGRGWGKTLTGAEATKECIDQLQGAGVQRVRWALVAPREADVLATMLEGETGLARVLPPSKLINGSWEDSLHRSKLELTLAGGHILKGFSGRVPANLRGPQHHGAWVDEPASLPDAAKGLEEDTAMSNLLFGLRLPPWNRLIITGTPRNVRLIRELRDIADGLIETHGRTRDNLHNLSATFKRVVVARYHGTRLGRQELDAEVLSGVGVMFARGWFPLGEPRHDDPLVGYDLEDGTWEHVRMWDLAATEASDMNADPDWTVGVRLAYRPAVRDPQTRRLLEPRRFVIVDVERFRLSAGERDDRIRDVADRDGLPVQWIEREPASAGKAQVHYLDKHLAGVARVEEFNPSGPKAVRAEQTAGPAQQGQVVVHPLPDGSEPGWYTDFLDEHEEFHYDPKLSGPHDDQVDATSAAFVVMLDQQAGFVVLAPADHGQRLPGPAAQRIPRAGAAGAPVAVGGRRIPRPSHRG